MPYRSKSSPGADNVVAQRLPLRATSHKRSQKARGKHCSCMFRQGPVVLLQQMRPTVTGDKWSKSLSLWRWPLCADTRPKQCVTVCSVMGVPADRRLRRSWQLPSANNGGSRSRPLRTPDAPWPIQPALEISTHVAAVPKRSELASAPRILACNIGGCWQRIVRAAMKPPRCGGPHGMCRGLTVVELAHYLPRIHDNWNRPLRHLPEYTQFRL